MRIAIVALTVPWPADSGGKLRSYHLFTTLAHHHAVDLYSVAYGVPPHGGSDSRPLVQRLRRITVVALGSHYTNWQRVRDLFAPVPRSVSYFATRQSLATLTPQLQQGYDLLICDELGMAPYILQAQKKLATPALLMRQKIDHQHYGELAAYKPLGVGKVLDRLEARRLLRYEARVVGQFDAAVVCSPDDQAITLQQAPHCRVAVVPNGADTAYYTPQRQPDPKPTLLFLGAMDYYPNIDAIQHFCSHSWPLLRTMLPDLQLLIVGRQPTAAVSQLGQLPGVTVTGSVPDVRPYLARSWVMVVPLRLGGGTRLKIAEAMAAGLPVVTTAVGAQGLPVVHGRHLLLAETSARFTDAVQQLLTNVPLREELAQNARLLVESELSWQALGRQFTQICEEVGH
ncbi:MAG: glycosyltransferase [Caldilineaceae bacterium]